MKRMVGTYSDIIKWVQTNYGFKPHDSWITHCKELAGLPVKGRYEGRRPVERQCPPNKQGAIFAAFLHFGLLPNDNMR